MTQPQYHMKRTKAVDLKANTVTYTLRLTTLTADDPGPDASVDIFQQYVMDLLRLRRERKAKK